MSIDLLFADFDRLIQSAESVHRLRRFILDLAVRGKLAPQDPNDEPASELLKRIAAEKARLVKAGAIGTGKILDELTDADKTFTVPEGWCWARLGNIATYLQRGKSPKYATGTDLLVVSQKCVKWNGLDLSVAKEIEAASLERYEGHRFLRDGDLLWNSTGTGTIGRIIRVESPPEKLVCDSHVTLIRCPHVVSEYLRTWLRSDHVYGVIESRAAGSTKQVELTTGLALNWQVPLPPLAEQHRIVAKVDELMILCNRLEAARVERESTRDRLATASLARLNAPDPDPARFQHDVEFALNNLAPPTTRPDQIKALRQTILNLAVHGKLVPQDPNDEPASELLKRVIAENEATFVKGRKRKFLIGLRSDDEVPKNIPATWTWSSIGQLASEMRYGTAKKCEHRIKGTPVLRIPNVSRGEVDLTNLKFGALTEEEKKTLLLRENDLLVVRSNGSLGIVGRAAIVNKAAESMSFAGYLVRIRFRQRYIHTRYIWLAMNSQHVRDLIEKPIRSTVGVKNVNSTELAAITIPLPPLAEQQRIVAKIDELMTLCDRMEASLAWGNDNRRQLIDALLHEALKPEEECEKLAG